MSYHEQRNGIIQLHRLGIRRSECGSVVVGVNKSLHGQLKDADKYIQNAVPDKWEDEEKEPITYGEKSRNMWYQINELRETLPQAWEALYTMACKMQELERKIERQDREGN